ncbi:MAG: hypothetical protein EHM33_19825 [Chloroflexi bacterium]|nr:MAG: hypothetical protein EHM33_19825 [Chloroflexota bacterium]
MEFDWTIAAWIAGLIFVYVFGLIEGRSKGYKKRKAEEAQEKPNQPSPKPEIVTVTTDDPGLLRIKNEGGSFTLDLDGARVNPISLLPDQRKRLIEILNILRPWLEGKPAPSATTSPPPSSRLAPVQPASLSPQPVVAPQTPAPKPVTIAKEDRPVAPANSIVTQIDTVLQAQLEGTPLGARGIFLTQSPEGGVAVYVGLTRYNGVDEVPDPEIKAAIRAAITEWENKYTPGL